MRILPNLSGKKTIAVIPTADASQRRVQVLLEELNQNTVDSIVVEDGSPTFSFSRSMNSGIAEALRHNPDCIILSNDDVYELHGVADMIEFVLSNRDHYAQPYVNGKRLMVNFTTSPLGLFIGYTLSRRAPIYAYKFTRNLMKLAPRFAVAVPTIRRKKGVLSVQPFGVFRADTLEQAKFDENFRIFVEDSEFALRLNLNGIHGETRKEWKASHEGGATLGKGTSEEKMKLVAAGAAYFYEKYFKPGNRADIKKVYLQNR